MASKDWLWLRVIGPSRCQHTSPGYGILLKSFQDRRVLRLPWPTWRSHQVSTTSGTKFDGLETRVDVIDNLRNGLRDDFGMSGGLENDVDGLGNGLGMRPQNRRPCRWLRDTNGFLDAKSGKGSVAGVNGFGMPGSGLRNGLGNVVDFDDVLHVDSVVDSGVDSNFDKVSRYCKLTCTRQLVRDKWEAEQQSVCPFIGPF